MAECCPTCERAFTSYKDYPILYIARFERIPVPELIGSNFGTIFSERKSRRSLNKPLPREVRKIFEKSGKDKISYEGTIYKKIGDMFQDGIVLYQSFQDVTELVKLAVGAVDDGERVTAPLVNPPQPVQLDTVRTAFAAEILVPLTVKSPLVVMLPAAFIPLKARMGLELVKV